MKWAKWWLFCCFLSIAGACGKSGTTGSAMAHLGDEPLVSEADVQHVLRRKGAFERSRFNAVDATDYREKVVRRIARRWLLYRAAKERGWLEEPRFRAAIREAVAAEVRRKYADDIRDVSSAEVEAYYARHTSEFSLPARRRVAQIVCATKAACVAHRAAVVRDAKSGVRAFQQLAGKLSREKQGRRRLADLGFITLESKWVPREVRVAAFALDKVGMVSEPIRVGEDWRLIQVVAILQGRSQPLARVRRILEERVRRRAQEAAIEDLLEDAGVNKLRVTTRPLQPSATAPLRPK